MTYLEALPIEILFMIASELDDTRDINSFVKTSRRFYTVMNQVLYDHDGLSNMKALKWASKHGLVKVAQMSIDVSSCPECRTNNLYKALSRAAANGHAAVVELLLQTPGIEANQQNYQSGTSVLNAVTSRSTETVSCFLRCKNLKIDLNNGNNLRRNPLILASKFDTPYIAKLLLTSPAIHVDYRDYNAATALHYAARLGSEETVRSLLECGANPDPHDSGGITPLFHAARRGNVSTVKMLLEAGADPHQTGSNGCHPLGAARDLGHIEVEKALLDCDRLNLDLLEPVRKDWQKFRYKQWARRRVPFPGDKPRPRFD